MTPEPNTPLPDPTILTTEALMREVESMKNIVDLRIEAVTKELGAKIDGEAALNEERLKGVDAKLEKAEEARVEQKADTKTAVDAALQAQKEAVSEQTTASDRAISKSETATTKSIEETNKTFSTALDGQSRETADLKDRLTTMESRQLGAGEAKAAQNITLGQIVAIASVSVGAFGVIAAVVIAVVS